MTTSVDPRNLGTVEERNCGNAPGAPSNCSVALADCEGAYGLVVAWDASTDDGDGENDVLWYEIYRWTNVESGCDDAADCFTFYSIVPADGSNSYSFLDTDVEKTAIYDTDPGSPTYGQFEDWEFSSHKYRIHAVDCGDAHSAGCSTATVTPTVAFPQDPIDIEAVGYALLCGPVVDGGRAARGSRIDHGGLAACARRSELG
ncbi:MAG: hypothetical protein M5R36_12600 [Deltaproteobacteria bacterium]|nr:hypothetical protein [Deltaproteobacteria bacterium]